MMTRREIVKEIDVLIEEAKKETNLTVVQFLEKQRQALASPMDEIPPLDFRGVWRTSTGVVVLVEVHSKVDKQWYGYLLNDKYDKVAVLVFDEAGNCISEQAVQCGKLMTKRRGDDTGW